MYAGASGDFNPIHYDHFVAVKAGLGGVMAHGMLSMGFAAQLIADPISAFGWVKEIRARFVSPVRPGDLIELNGVVVEVFKNQYEQCEARIEINASADGRTVLLGAALVAPHAGLSQTL